MAKDKKRLKAHVVPLSIQVLNPTVNPIQTKCNVFIFLVLETGGGEGVGVGRTMGPDCGLNDTE
jgi:hypothetical protein